MVVGKYVDGRELAYDAEGGGFAVGGTPITISQALEYDAAGQIEWASDETRAWARSLRLPPVPQTPVTPINAFPATTSDVGALAPGTGKKPWFKKWWVWAIAVLIIAIAAAASGGSGTTESPQATPAATAPAVTATAAEQPPVSEPVAAEPVAPEPEPVPAAPSMTMGQENAVAKAESYLSYAAFSRKGLIGQLKYEGFSTSDATFAVGHITVNWNEQAATKAQSYIDMTSFSRQGLIDQLVYEGFTQTQAKYGAKAVGY